MTAINFFRAGDNYLFKHYFEDRKVFEEFRPYYDSLEYRFEVRKEVLDDFEEIARELEEKFEEGVKTSLPPNIPKKPEEVM